MSNPMRDTVTIHLPEKSESFTLTVQKGDKSITRIGTISGAYTNDDRKRLVKWVDGADVNVVVVKAEDE
jgi:hypothetical protein